MTLKVGDVVTMRIWSKEIPLTTNAEMSSSALEDYQEVRGTIIGIRKPFFRRHHWVILGDDGVIREQGI